MSLHLFFWPINDLLKTVDIAEHRVVTDGFGNFSAFFIKDRLDFDILGQRIPPDEFAVLDFGDDQFFILPAADRELDIASVAEDEGCDLAIILPVVKRHKVVLAELGRRSKPQSVSAQSSGKDSGSLALLNSGIGRNHRSDRRRKLLNLLRIAKGILQRLLIRRCLNHGRELRLARLNTILLCLVVVLLIVTHNVTPPCSNNLLCTARQP